MTQIIFTETQTATKTNIAASFQFWSKETFLKEAYAVKKYHGRYRYGYVDDGWVKLVKDMSLEEFESVFSPAEIDNFTTEQITQIFRKEISEKYGEHKVKAEIKTLSKKELVKGTVYTDLNGYKYLYLGKGKIRIERNPGYGRNELKEEKEGEVFKSMSTDTPFTDSHITTVDVLKGIKKLVKPIRTVELKDSYSHTVPKTGYRYYNEFYTLELY